MNSEITKDELVLDCLECLRIARTVITSRQNSSERFDILREIVGISESTISTFVPENNSSERSTVASDLKRFKKEFDHFQSSSYRKTDLRETKVPLVQSINFALSVGALEDYIKQYFVQRNPGSSADEFLSGDTLVIAPLSGDYLIAKLLEYYVRIENRTSFTVAPIVLDRFLDNPVMLPEHYGPWGKIAAFIDYQENGDTMYRVKECVSTIFEVQKNEILEGYLGKPY